MAMQTIKMNKSNWSGEIGEVRMDLEAGILEVYEYRFRVEEIRCAPEDGDLFPWGIIGYRCVSADGSWTPDHVLAKCYVDEHPVDLPGVYRSIAVCLFNTL